MIAIKTTMIPVGYRVMMDFRDTVSDKNPSLFESIDTGGTDVESLSDPEQFMPLLCDSYGVPEPQWSQALTKSQTPLKSIARVLSWVNLAMISGGTGRYDGLACGLFQLSDGGYLFVYTEISILNATASTVKFCKNTNLGIILDKLDKYPSQEIWALVRLGAYGGLDHLLAQAMAQELEA